MHSRMTKKLIALVLVVCFLLGSFISIESSEVYAAKKSKKQSITLNYKEYTIKKGKTLKLKASVSPSKLKQKKVIWVSSNSKVATVKNGKVKAVSKSGKAVITAKVKGTKLSAKTVIHIGTPVKKAVFSTKNISMVKGEIKSIKASVLPKKSTVKSIKYVSSNNNVAKVDNKGNVTAVAAGTVKISAIPKDEAGKKAVMTVTVTDYTAPVTPVNPPVAPVAQKLSFTVTFDSNGGSAIPSQIVDAGGVAIKPNDPTREGYSFDYWSYDDEKYDFSTPIYSNIKLIAEWSEKEIDNLADDIVDKGDLQYLYDKGVIDVSYGKDGSVEDINGKFTDEKIYDEDDALDYMKENTSFLNGFSDCSSDVFSQSTDDESYYRMTPEVKGIPVLGSQVILSTDDSGTVTGLTSSFESKITDVSTYTDISEDEAIEEALYEVMNSEMVDSYITANLDDGEEYQTLYDDFYDALEATAELIIYAADDTDKPRLVYKVDVSGPFFDIEDDGDIGFIFKTVFVNANDEYDDEGTIYLTIDHSEDWTDTSVNSSDISGVNKGTINVQKDGNKYRLLDNTRNIGIFKTKHCSFLWWNWIGDLPGEIATTGGSNNHVDDEAVYCMVNMKKTYDYYKNVLGRKSFDGKGADVIVSYDYYDKNYGGGKYYNAAWCSGDTQQFIFGNDGNLFKGADVFGHEFTHAVINYIVGDGHNNTLTYIKESGALNESYADIMGNIIEGKADNGRWLMGEDTYSVIRSMSSPSSFNDPEHYNDRFLGSQDHYGVHTNSSIFNFAAYKMMTDERTSGVSNDTWAKVFYKSLYRLTTDATFLQARRAVLYAANRVGFTQEQQQAIKDAYDAVGIVEPDSIRIVLTWGSEPEDLDSHLVGPMYGSDGRFHIYFEDKTYFDKDNNIFVADLDYDDTTSYGPEVTTIHDMYPGEYYFYVHDYTTGESADSTVMARSGATIKIYKGKSKNPIATYSINSNSSGTIWNVCKLVIKNGNVNVTPINTYDSVATYE